MTRPRFRPTFSRVTLPTVTMRPPTSQRMERREERGRADGVDGHVDRGCRPGVDDRPRARRGRAGRHRDRASRTSATTCAPRRAAICTAAVPTPPFAPVTSTRSPARTRPRVTRSRYAVPKVQWSTAACAAGRSLGDRVERRRGGHDLARIASVRQETEDPRRPGAERRVAPLARGALAACVAVHRGHAIARRRTSVTPGPVATTRPAAS